MRILIVGAGGREHALLWKLRKDAPDAAFFATRPNGGMAGLCTAVDLSPDDVEGVAAWAARARIDLAVIGPEAPLAAGVSDRLAGAGTPVFGPSAGAARIESSKAFAKDLMRDAGVPTARYRVHSEPDVAEAHIRSVGAPVVVKASGLAAGKGAVVCRSVEEAAETARRMLGGAFGPAGAQVVVEECMEGEELSVFCIADGEEFATMLPSQDHKRIGEGDTGPNTGGMGAYAPVGFVTEALLAEVGERIVAPTLRALAESGSPFRGLLYAGLMITAEGPKVVEFNCRFGDPETQAVLPLLDSSLLEPMLAVAEGSGLKGHAPVFRDAAAVATVVAAEGYPGPCPKGLPISIPSLPGVHVFHAGTATGPAPGSFATSGGRVLAVTAVDRDFEAARDASRAAAEAVEFEGKRFRRDIGWRESRRRLGRPTTESRGRRPRPRQSNADPNRQTPTRGAPSMTITTTPTLQGRPIREYLGIVTGEAIIGANIFKDLLAGIRDIVGGRSGAYEDALRTAREHALREMSHEAAARGAEAVVGVDLDYEVLGSGQGMLMVTACGTAVALE